MSSCSRVCVQAGKKKKKKKGDTGEAAGSPASERRVGLHPTQISVRRQIQYVRVRGQSPLLVFMCACAHSQAAVGHMGTAYIALKGSCSTLIYESD